MSNTNCPYTVNGECEICPDVNPCSGTLDEQADCAYRGGQNVIMLKQYDYDVADDVFSALFCHSGRETEEGYVEIPSASYQLVVSALEYITYECKGADRDAIKKARGIVERCRDRQKMREWKRKGE